MRIYTCLLSSVFMLLLPAIVLGDDIGEHGECLSDYDCPPEHVCEVFCNDVGFAECTVDADCDAGLVCVDGCCVGEDVSCERECYGQCVPADFALTYECETDADCAEDERCFSITGDHCFTDSEGNTECDTFVESGCVPHWVVHCETDADCLAGLSCTSLDEEECYSMPCEPGTDCSDLELECYTYHASICLPPFETDCTEDADCGEGFRCVMDSLCQCDGSVEPHDGDTGFEDYEEHCDCVELELGWCELVPVACDSKDDCPQGWSCEAGGYMYDGNSRIDDEDEPHSNNSNNESDRTNICYPPFWDDFYGYGDEDSAGYDNDLGYEESGDTGADDGSAESDDRETGDSDSDDTDRQPTDEDGSDTDTSSVGCSTASGNQGIAGLFILLAAGLLLNRRTARQ